MKRANHGTKLEGTPKAGVPPIPTPQTGKNPTDARDDSAQQKKNQKDLRVGPDHKTEEMEEGNRGTFP
jgi:hypothetical protein